VARREGGQLLIKKANFSSKMHIFCQKSQFFEYFWRKMLFLVGFGQKFDFLKNGSVFTQK
jgi:hypothetical protein